MHSSTFIVRRTSPARALVYLGVCLLTIAGAACSSGKKKSSPQPTGGGGGGGSSGGGGATVTNCSGANASSAACAAFTITDVSPKVVAPGKTVTLTGTNFRSGLDVAVLGLNDSAPVVSVKVESDTKATVYIPADIRYGALSLNVVQDGTSHNLALFSAGDKTDYPIITASPAVVCSGTTFYDAAGSVQQGQAACGAPAACGSDGAIGCVTVAAFPAVELARATAANIKSGVTLGGVGGAFAPACSSDGQQDCLVANAFRAANTAAISAWDLRSGSTLGGIAGALKTNCRNGVDAGHYNFDGLVTALPTGASTVSSTNYDIWDTTDDYYGFSATPVTAWPASTYCDASTWADVTTADAGVTVSTCAASPSHCQLKDKVTNLVVSHLIASAQTWPAAVSGCQALTLGGYAAGTWHLATQKETMALYEHGLNSRIAAEFINSSDIQSEFWTSSTLSTTPTRAWISYLATGDVYSGFKTDPRPYFCVR